MWKYDCMNVCESTCRYVMMCSSTYVICSCQRSKQMVAISERKYYTDSLYPICSIIVWGCYENVLSSGSDNFETMTNFIRTRNETQQNQANEHLCKSKHNKWPQFHKKLIWAISILDFCWLPVFFNFFYICTHRKINITTIYLFSKVHHMCDLPGLGITTGSIK